MSNFELRRRRNMYDRELDNMQTQIDRISEMIKKYRNEAQIIDLASKDLQKEYDSALESGDEKRIAEAKRAYANDNSSSMIMNLHQKIRSLETERKRLEREKSAILDKIIELTNQINDEGR